MENKAAYWIDLAEYDLDTAKAMLKHKRYLYVGFMCHQVIEKGFKAVIVSIAKEGEFPPKIHHLNKLADSAGLYQKLNEKQKELIIKLLPMNIEARYPENKIRLLETLSENDCKQMIAETEELFLWIKKQF